MSKSNKGYEVVYKVGERIFHAGMSVIFPCYRLAAQYRKRYQERPWMEDRELFIRRVDDYTVYSKPKEYNGKLVYPEDWIPNIDCLDSGNLVDSKFVDIYINQITPACYKPGFFQLGGEPVCRYVDDRFFYVYPTFIMLSDEVWEYKGYCTKGHSKEVA